MSEAADKRRGGGDTREALLEAAAAEFNAKGFGGTDTNRIARAAGFAPQTFYRHFADKTEVFIAVYGRWQEDEARKIAAAVRGEPDAGAQAIAAARTLIAAHRGWARFRRSLRMLALEDPRVRAARAASRRAQLAAVGGDADGTGWTERVAALLTIERLCDAVADEEIGDLAADEAVWTGLVAEAIRSLQAAGRRA